MNNFNFSPIGHISSCFKEKFTIPRQPRLLPSISAELILDSPYAVSESVRGLEGFSHVWVIFVFHAVPVGQWKPTVRPPRLGGNKRLGVFATRSTHRPNPIGMSVVDLLGVDTSDGKVKLILGGCDFLDGTPVLDIKPYLPYVDAISDATAGFAPDVPSQLLSVTLSETAERQCLEAAQRLKKDIKSVISGLLTFDPRPAYQSGEYGERIYATHLYDVNLRWRYLTQHLVEVIDLDKKDNVSNA